MTHTIQTLSLADAKAMTQAAEAHAATLGIPFSIAVVDGGGHLLSFSRGDGGAVGCVDLAINKAFTAVAYGRATADIAPLAQPGAPLFGLQHSLNGRAVVFGGGVPVTSHGAVIGAVGASAGTIEQDISVAMAALSALTDTATPTAPRVPTAS
ncbi:GlcG/HbpS family heme-binding protein [Roseateles amylovorans]|uniref:Heme-binding protein n=1 Tax=Roseateles amylovorans TaxID=2978473 RepID=A0ABY6B499_9BURK|nr:heme-binding protein [Roseateles amylovorans]UXH79087.1 heme-binding protein [Roseateles amylovorans]